MWTRSAIFPSVPARHSEKFSVTASSRMVLCRSMTNRLSTDSGRVARVWRAFSRRSDSNV